MNVKMMTLSSILLCLSFQSWSSQCAPQDPTESVVSREDFPWGQSLAEIRLLADKIYESGKRLKDRAYVRGDQIILPMPLEKAKAWDFKFKNLKIENTFVENLKQHIKKIYEASLGSELIYSDVGHFHVFAYHEDSAELKEKGMGSSSAEYYESILHSENTKFLYHTSEQLGKPETDEEKWRKLNRTVVGDAKGNIKSVEFTKSIRGYSQFFSIYFNASSLGCFSMDGEKFDISLSSPK